MGREVTAVSFAFYSTEEIRRLSVKVTLGCAQKNLTSTK